MKIASNNKLFLNFSLSLKTEITENDIEAIVKGKKFEINLYAKSSKILIITLRDKFDIKEKELIILRIKLPRVLSISNSSLFNHTYSGLLNSNIQGFAFFGVDIKQGIKVILFSSIATSLASNPSSLWSILNTIQLIIYMPLNSISYPSQLRHLSGSLIDYNIIPNLLNEFIHPNSTSIPYAVAYNFGIKTSVLLINLGSMIIILLSIILVSLFVIPLAKQVFISEKFLIKSSAWKYGSFFRFWIQGYLEFGIFCIIQLKSELINDSIQQTIFGTFSLCLSGVFGVIFI